jgi:hypothetical protein
MVPNQDPYLSLLTIKKPAITLGLALKSNGLPRKNDSRGVSLPFTHYFSSMPPKTKTPKSKTTKASKSKSKSKPLLSSGKLIQKMAGMALAAGNAKEAGR